MPTPPTLTDIARLRVEAISFFIAVLLASAALVRLIWNGLARQLPAAAAAHVRQGHRARVLWGLLFIVVLTMISGARRADDAGRVGTRRGDVSAERRGQVA